MGAGNYKIARHVRRAERIRYWLPALIWAAILLAASGNAAAAGNTAGIIRAILAATIGPLPDPAFEAIHFAFRKSGHVLAYAIAGGLNFYAVRCGRGGWMLRWSAVAVLLATLTASLDEWHQSYFTSRTGVPTDVVIDFCGAVLAQVIVRLRAVRDVSSRA